MFGKKRVPSTEVATTAPVDYEVVPSTEGRYRIEVHLVGTSWMWEVIDPELEAQEEKYKRWGSKGPGVKADDFVHFSREKPGDAERSHKLAIKRARAWVDQQLEIDAFEVKYGERYVEWYGKTPENTTKIIETQRTYIEELEAKIDEARGEDGRLDPERLVA
jgi:hypothetical protein